MTESYKCPQCGKDVPYIVNPCPNCKLRLDWTHQPPIPYVPSPMETQPQQVIQQPIYQQPVYQQPTYQQPTYEPQAGAPHQQTVQPTANLPPTKNTTSPLVIILAIVGGGVLLLLGTCSICMGTFMAKPSTTVPAQTQNYEPPIYISTSDLYQEYNDNEVSADMKYKGRILVVSGIVESVGKDILDTPYIKLEGGDKYGIAAVQCMFSKTDLNILAGVSKGSRISIQGICRGGKIMWPILENCSIK